MTGVLLMLAAALCYAVMGAFVKMAGAVYPAVVIVLARSVVIVVAAAVLLRARRASWRPGNPRLLLARSVTGFVAMAAYYYAITRIPLASAVTIQFTSPLFVALWGGLMLGERVGRRTTVCIVTALVGATVIVAPDAAGFEPASLIALFSAMLAGVAYVLVRQLRTTDAPETIVFNFSLFALVFSLPALAWVEAWPSLGTLGVLLGVGLSAFGGQTLMTYAFRYGEAAFISAFSYATVLFSAVAGFMLFGEVPGLQTLAGAALIVGAGIVLTRGKLREERVLVPPNPVS